MRVKTFFLLISLCLVLTANVFSQTAKTYTDAKNGFSVSYPSDFKVLTGAKAKSETAFGDPGAGVKLVSVTPAHIPNKYHGDYEFNVWRSSSAAKCEASAAEENVGNIPVETPEADKTKMIGGHTFYAYTGGDGGMSKSLTLHGYRGVGGGKCWQIQSMTYQVSAFDDYKTFDDKIIDAAFAKFVSSFKFTAK